MDWNFNNNPSNRRGHNKSQGKNRVTGIMKRYNQRKGYKDQDNIKTISREMKPEK